jgi:hypothetical protein
MQVHDHGDVNACNISHLYRCHLLTMNVVHSLPCRGQSLGTNLKRTNIKSGMSWSMPYQYPKPNVRKQLNRERGYNKHP